MWPWLCFLSYHPLCLCFHVTYMYSVLCLHQSPWGLTSQHLDTSLCLFRLFCWPGMFSTHSQSHSENVTTFHSLALMVPLLAGQSRFLPILNWPPPLLCSLYTWLMLSLQSLSQLLWIIVTTLCLFPPSYLKHVSFLYFPPYLMW